MSASARASPGPGSLTSCPASTSAGGSAADGRTTWLCCDRASRLRRDPAATRGLGSRGFAGRRDRAGHRSVVQQLVLVGLVVDRHVLGERRDRGVPVGVVLDPGLRALVGEQDVGLRRLQVHEDARRDEDRREHAGCHTHELREREVLQRARAELHGAHVEDRADRDQGHDRGVDRADQGLVDREVRRLGVRLPAGPELVGVLPDLVEHDDRVVHREAEDRQQTGHGCRRHREAGERVDADGQHDVVSQCDQRRDRHLPLAEVGPDEHHDQEQEDHHAQDGALSDLLAPARTDLVPGDLIVGCTGGVDDDLADLDVLRGGQVLGLDHDAAEVTLSTGGGHGRLGGEARDRGPDLVTQLVGGLLGGHARSAGRSACTACRR